MSETTLTPCTTCAKPLPSYALYPDEQNRMFCWPCRDKLYSPSGSAEPNGQLSASHPGIGSVTSWAPVDLGPILDGTEPDPPPSILTRTDGRALLYPGRVHALFGEPEACKGWLALAATAEVLKAGERVLYVDFEDTPASIAGRLKALGVPLDAIRERFVYVRPDEPLGNTGGADLDAAAVGVSLAVLDGITEALTMHGLDLASNTDVAAWLELLPRPLARTGAAVLTIDHVVKDRENRGRYAIGAQHKLAGVDCAYSAQVIEPFGRGRDGRVKVTVTKDRPGHVRSFAEEGRAAEVRLCSHDDGTVTVTLVSPEAGGAFRPTWIMERVSRAVEDEPGIGTNAIKRTVKKKAKFVQDAIALLVEEGFIDQRKDGTGKAARHYSVKPFRDDETNRVPPSPDRFPEPVGDTGSPVPHPVGGTGPGTGIDGLAEITDRVPTPSGLPATRPDAETCDHCSSLLAPFGGRLVCVDRDCTATREAA
jgi:hypothetical protein